MQAILSYCDTFVFGYFVGVGCAGIILSIILHITRCDNCCQRGEASE